MEAERQQQAEEVGDDETRVATDALQEQAADVVALAAQQNAVYAQQAQLLLQTQQALWQQGREAAAMRERAESAERRMNAVLPLIKVSASTAEDMLARLASATSLGDLSDLSRMAFEVRTTLLSAEERASGRLPESSEAGPRGPAGGAPLRIGAGTATGRTPQAAQRRKAAAPAPAVKAAPVPLAFGRKVDTALPTPRAGRRAVPPAAAAASSRRSAAPVSRERSAGRASHADAAPALSAFRPQALAWADYNQPSYYPQRQSEQQHPAGSGDGYGTQQLIDPLSALYQAHNAVASYNQLAQFAPWVFQQQ